MGNNFFYKKVAYNWLSVSHIEPPTQDLLGTQIPQSSSSIGIMRIDKQYYEIILLLCSGKLYMSKWLTYGDDFHLMEKDLLPKQIVKINMNDYKTLLESNVFVVSVFRTGCGYCEKFKSVLNSVFL